MFAPFRPTLRYVMETEVHVYAFSMAANVLLSFFPFLIVMTGICRHVLQWPAAEQAIYLALKDFFPGPIERMIHYDLARLVGQRPFQVTSVFLLLFTANGIFEPLEVALNKAWGIRTNRSFVRNQIVSLGLIFACGALVLVSTLLTAINQQIWQELGYGRAQITTWMNLAVFKFFALPISVLALFLVYWLLPNGKVPKRCLVPAAILVGALEELLKYLYIVGWPAISRKLAAEYGPFYHSVSIILWSFLASMVVLAGADWAARMARARQAEDPERIRHVTLPL